MSQQPEIIEYYEQLATAYDENRFGNSYGQFVHQREYDILYPILTNSTGVTVNVACGTGRFMEFADIGIDASKGMIFQAQKKHPKKSFAVVDATNLPFENESVDTIICLHLFMHLPLENINKIISEFHRVLKPEGLIIFDYPSTARRKIRVPNEQKWHGQTTLTPRWIADYHGIDWEIIQHQGILYLPIQRVPNNLRKHFIQLDKACGRLLPVHHAQYIISTLKKNSPLIGKLLPKSLKAKIRFHQRTRADRQNGTNQLLASKKDFKLDCGSSFISLSQPIRPGATFNQKVINIEVASKGISQVVVMPGEIFSFWKIVPRPTKKNGFVKSRNLVNGEISTAIGGGICQLASITYHIALLAGLDVIERHNHSLDIYEEHDRFTPLGADAAVVWGHKDLRFKNNNEHKIWFKVLIKKEKITLELHCSGQIAPNEIDFRRQPDSEGIRTVETHINGYHVTTSIYALPSRA